MRRLLREPRHVKEIMAKKGKGYNMIRCYSTTTNIKKLTKAGWTIWRPFGRGWTLDTSLD